MTYVTTSLAQISQALFRVTCMDRYASLDTFFRPTSVAVVGASVTPGSVGSILMHNLLQTPFGGVVYPINPKRKAVHGVYCYPSLMDTPEVVDLAVIATPAATVPAMIEQCVARGVRSAIVISAGFSDNAAYQYPRQLAVSPSIHPAS